MNSRLPPTKLIIVTGVLSLAGSWHFGYQLTCVNATEFVFKNFLNSSHYNNFGSFLTTGRLEFLWSWIVNLPNIGCLLATIFGWFLLKNSGRKAAFYIIVILEIIGPFLCALSFYVARWEVLAVGRLVSGFGTGLAFCIQPVFFSEISPDEFRGFLSAMTGVYVEMGYVLGSLTALPELLGTDALWPWVFWIEIPCNLAALILLQFMHESPKFLLANKNDVVNSHKSLTFYQHDNCEKGIDDIRREIQMEKNSLTIKQVLKKRYLRKGLLLSCLVQFAASYSGIAVISYFSTRLLMQVGIQELIAGYATVALTIFCFLAAILNSFLTDRLGRRPLLIFSLFAIGFIHLAIAICSNLAKSFPDSVWPAICIFLFIFYAFLFGLGVSSIQWFVASELAPQNAKSTAVSWTMVMQWLCFMTSVFVFLFLETILREWTFLIFVICTILPALYFYFQFPETTREEPMSIFYKLGYRGDDQHEFEETST